MSEKMKYTPIACNWVSIGVLILQYHYLHRMPAGIIQCFALIDENGITPVGAAVFTNGKESLADTYIEFARLWVDDKCPRNTESYFVAYCMKYLHEHYPQFKGVVTWADPMVGHTGTLYRACNFIYDGLSAKTKTYKNKATGKMVNNRTRSDESNRDKQDQFEVVGENARKRRFVYIFDPKERELQRQLNKGMIDNNRSVLTLDK